MKRIRPRNRLVEWAVAREALRLKKEEGGMPPWSDDPILNEYRFCNVRRRDDRVSKWLIENVLCYYGEDIDLWTFLQWTALCRWINWPPTLKAIMELELVTYDEIDFSAIGTLIDERREGGNKAWTGAYMVRAPSARGGYPGYGKSRFVTEVVVEQGLNSVKDQLYAMVHCGMLAHVYNVLCSVPNWGSFMSGQVVADWSYTPLLDQARDLYSWAPFGPGSRRGYNRMLGLPLKHPAPSEDVWCEQLMEWRADILLALGGKHETFTLHDVQNCLCELDKYERVRLGEGRPRSRYVQETAYGTQ